MQPGRLKQSLSDACPSVEHALMKSLDDIQGYNSFQSQRSSTSETEPGSKNVDIEEKEFRLVRTVLHGYELDLLYCYTRKDVSCLRMRYLSNSKESNERPYTYIVADSNNYFWRTSEALWKSSKCSEITLARTFALVCRTHLKWRIVFVR